MRLTAPRRAVLHALAGRRDHPTAEEVVAAVAAAAPAVHRASVYRALDALGRAGVVRHVHVGSGATRFSLADDESHLHARCRVCGAVVDLPADLLAEAAARLRVEQGFELDAAHVALSGTCAACARA